MSSSIRGRADDDWVKGVSEGARTGGLIVAVDDDAAMRRVLMRVLEWRGFAARIAATREEGFALIVAERPAVVLLEYDIAGASGLALAEDVRAVLGRDAPPIVLVAAAADRIPRAERERFEAVHTKPFRASALLDDVERLAARGARKVSGVREVHGGRRRAEGE